MKFSKQVAITGIGAVCALGSSIAEAAEVLFEESPERRLSSSSLLMNGSTVPLGFPFYAVPDSVWGEKLRTGSAEDTFRIGMHAAREALACAGTWERNMAVVAGTTSGSALHFLDGYACFRKGQERGADCDSWLVSNPSLAIGVALNLCGPKITVSNACVSGADAIGIAAGMIASGQCLTALCGGLDALSIVPHTGFARLMIYDSEPCRPYSANRRGLNLGEGAAFLVLEDAAHAKERGVTVLGWLTGYGSASDAHHFTAPHPDAAGLEAAIDAAGLRGAALAFINVHGTGTKENDRVEGSALRRMFPGTPLWATKGLTGHTLGAAGALETVLTLMALHRGIVPASVACGPEDPDIGATPTACAVPCRSKAAISTSLGFGGGNSVIGIEVD